MIFIFDSLPYHLPYQKEYYFYDFKPHLFIKGIYLLILSCLVFFWATLMKERRTLLKGSIIVSVASFLSVGGVLGLIGGIIGIIAAKRQEK